MGLANHLTKCLWLQPGRSCNAWGCVSKRVARIWTCRRSSFVPAGCKTQGGPPLTCLFGTLTHTNNSSVVHFLKSMLGNAIRKQFTQNLKCGTDLPSGFLFRSWLSQPVKSQRSGFPGTSRVSFSSMSSCWHLPQSGAHRATRAHRQFTYCP